MTADIQAQRPTGGMPSGHPTWNLAVQMALPTAPGRFVNFPGTTGNYLQVADNATFETAGDLSVAVRARMPDWTPSVYRPLVSRWSSTGNFAWLLRLESSGVPGFWWSTNGTTVLGVTAPALTVASYDWKWLAVTLDVNGGATNNIVRWWTSDDGSAWTLHHTNTTAGVTSINTAGNSPILIGVQGNDPTGSKYVGDISHVRVAHGIASNGSPVGTTRFELQPVDIPTTEDPSFTSTSGHTVTVARNGETPTNFDLGDVVGWVDMIGEIRGVGWERGSDVPGERPTTGVWEVTLDNRDKAWTPWAAAKIARYYGPGTLMRIAIYSTTEPDWVPQITGTVESWEEETDALGRESMIHVTLTETVAELASINQNAVTLAGAGEVAGQRAARLLAAADWTRGFYDEAASLITLQSTDMSRNRLAEMHLTADSTDTWFRSHRSGFAMFEQADPVEHPTYAPINPYSWGVDKWGEAEWSESTEPEWWTFRAASRYFRAVELRPDTAGMSLPDRSGRTALTLVYDADSLQGRNDLEIMRNDVRLANVGGVQQVVSDELSVSKHKRRVTYARSDLITQNQGNVAAIAQDICDRRAWSVLRVESVDLYGRPENLFGMFILDVGDPVTVVLSNYRGVRGHIIGVRHEITPKQEGGPMWTCSLSLETYPGFIEPAIVAG